MKYKKNNVYTKLYSTTVFIGTVVALLMFVFLDIGDYKIVALLPLAYLVCYCVCSKNRKYISNISLLIINISMLCRYVVYPVIIALTVNGGGYYRFDKQCVWLLIYELVGVFVIIGIFADKLDVQKIEKNNMSLTIGIPNVLLIMVQIPILILYPSLLTKFSTSSVVNKDSTAPGIVEILFIMGIWVCFIYALTLLESKKYKSIIQKNINFIIVVCIAMYYILFNTISGDDVKRWQIIACGIAMIYVVIRLFPEKKKFILIIGMAGIFTAVLIGSFVKFGISMSAENFVKKYLELAHFTEYFGGMRNITVALNVFEHNTYVQGIESTLTDLFSGVPILSTLFDYDSYSTPAIFQRYVNRTDIICPLTAQSITHFGYIGTPVLAMCMTYFSIIFNRALKKTKSLYSAYVLIELIVFFSLFIELNTTIIMGKLWIRLMFLLIQKIDARTKIRIKR